MTLIAPVSKQLHLQLGPAEAVRGFPAPRPR
jgi:hypothetical protein